MAGVEWPWSPQFLVTVQSFPAELILSVTHRPDCNSGWRPKRVELLPLALTGRCDWLGWPVVASGFSTNR